MLISDERSDPPRFRYPEELQVETMTADASAWWLYFSGLAALCMLLLLV